MNVGRIWLLVSWDAGCFARIACMNDADVKIDAGEGDIESLAAAYLECNRQLRDALGIGHDERLVAHHLGMGEHNLNYWFENPVSRERFVLRINVTKQPFHDNQVRYEFDALKALEFSGRTPKPLYLDDSPQAPCEGAMVIGFCEGEQLDFDNLLPGDLDRAAHIMADIHSVAIPSNCKLYRPIDPIRKLFNECFSRYEMYARSGFADPEVSRRMERFVRITQRCVDETEFNPAQARIVNTETLASHFLLPSDRAHGSTRSGYFVDWERPILGDVAEDVAFLVAPTTTFWDSDYLFPAGRFEEFVEAYWHAVDGRFERGDFDRHFAAFLKVATFRALTWCCRAVVQQKSGSKVHITDKAKAKVPIYLSAEFMDYLANEIFARASY